MQHVAVFEEQVALTARDMRGEIQSLDAEILKKLQARLEGKCSRHGFVLAGTLKILSRSMGHLEKGRFTGAILYHVQAEGEVLNPPDGSILEGEVIRKNKMGMYVNYQDAIRVIVPRDLHIGDDDFEAVEIGEKVRVEIKKSRFQVNDPFILSVGIFKGSLGKVAKKPGLEGAEEGDQAEDGAPDEESGEAEESGGEDASVASSRSGVASEEEEEEETGAESAEEGGV